MEPLTAAVVAACAALALPVLADLARAGVGDLRRGLRAAAGRRPRWTERLRDVGSAVLARRAAGAILGSGYALATFAAPARAAAAPDRALAARADARPQPAAPPATATVAPDPEQEVGAYSETVVVRRGDTLWDLARRHLPAGASATEIARAWPLWYAANRAVIGPDPGLLLPGQHLRVPGSRPTGTSSTHHRSPAATGAGTATPATSFDPDRR